MIVVPDEPVATILDGLRRRFDPHVDLVPPHITVAFPAKPVPAGDAIGLLDRLAASVAPFDVSLSAPRGPAAVDGPLGDQLAFLVGRSPLHGPGRA